MEDLKEGMLKALKELNIKASDFTHNYDGSSYTNSEIQRGMIVDNYSISIELTERLKWNGHNECRFDDLQISFLEILNGSGKDIDTNFITDNEILNAINY